MEGELGRQGSFKGTATVTPTPKSMLGGADEDGYGTDSEAATPTKRAQARRASLSLKNQFDTEHKRSRRASMSEALPNYHLSTDEDEEIIEAAPLRTGGRRASMSGAINNGPMPRRMSNQGAMPRRMSNQGAMPRRMSNQGAMPRRMSNQGAMPRRMSNQGGMPRRMSNQGRRMSNGYESPKQNRRKSSGINPEAVARMSRRMSNGGAQQPEDEADYEYEDHTAYGYYGYGAPQADPGPQPRYERRGSNRSAASGRSRRSSASSRSRRRNSTIIRNNTDIATSVEGAPRMSDSDMASDDSNGMYSYVVGSARCDSGVDSESENSLSSNRCSRRRNSCIIRPDQDPLNSSFVLDSNARPLRSGRDLLMGKDDDEEEDDANDPDSLLNRSGYLNTVTAHLMSSDEDVLKVDKPAPESPKRKKAETPEALSMKAATNKSIKPAIVARRDSWGRATPFTTSHVTLTKEKLADAEKAAKDQKIPGYSLRNNWGEMGLESMSSSDSESAESFGPSMYTDSHTFQEIDRYKQRARRRSSLEKTWIHMGNLLEEDKKKDTQQRHRSVPDFKPATGCTNASDFVVRCFCARLRSGFTVIKHNRSRWSKSQLRILYLLPDGKTLSWKTLEGEQDKGKRPKLDLTKCKEVRHAWSPDPETRKQLGTAIIRKRCKDGTANKSFALIFSKRTLDMTALSSDQCRVLMEGFSALCFRLQMDRLEDDNTSDDGPRDNTSRSFLTDDDWASTVYGGESTVSMTISATTGAGGPPLASPWGL